MTNIYHIPVLLKESLNLMTINPDGIYVDTTFGSGGHSLAILKQLSPKGKLISFDQDEDSTQNLSPFEAYKNFIFIKANFKYLRQYLDYHDIALVDGILADLGISLHQITKAERGFSIKYDANLDMRMSIKQKLNAYEVINTYSQEKLAYLLKNFGEIRQANQLAEKILEIRKQTTIKTTQDLIKVVEACYSKNISFRVMAQIFQAFRIEVNQELEALKILLQESTTLLKPQAKIAIIAYHSLEDRIVKFFFKTGNFEGIPKKDFYGKLLRPLNPLVTKPIRPKNSEIHCNKQARSAKLRVAEKI